MNCGDRGGVRKKGKKGTHPFCCLGMWKRGTEGVLKKPPFWRHARLNSGVSMLRERLSSPAPQITCDLEFPQQPAPVDRQLIPHTSHLPFFTTQDFDRPAQRGDGHSRKDRREREVIYRAVWCFGSEGWATLLPTNESSFGISGFEGWRTFPQALG